MTGWLLEHQFSFWLGALGLVAVWESFGPLRAPSRTTAARWSRNFTLVALDLLIVRFCLPVTAVAVAISAEQAGWGILNQLPVPFWFSCAAAIVVLDLGNYAMHRVFHAIPLLWRCHRIHHSDLDFDCTTAFRHHPVEYALVVGTNLALVALIGAPPVAVLAQATLVLVVSVFNHGNVAIPEVVDRVLRQFLVTPDMHRIHHSALQSEGNRNFGGVLPWWDRIFGTYQGVPMIDRRRMALGLAEARSPDDVTLLKLLTLTVPTGAGGSARTGRTVT